MPKDTPTLKIETKQALDSARTILDIQPFELDHCEAAVRCLRKANAALTEVHNRLRGVIPPKEGE